MGTHCIVGGARSQSNHHREDQKDRGKHNDDPYDGAAQGRAGCPLQKDATYLVRQETSLAMKQHARSTQKCYEDPPVVSVDQTHYEKNANQSPETNSCGKSDGYGVGFRVKA